MIVRPLFTIIIRIFWFQTNVNSLSGVTWSIFVTWSMVLATEWSMILTIYKVLCCTLFLGMIITAFMKEDNRRQAADQERANSIVTSQLLESKSNREDFSEKI